MATSGVVVITGATGMLGARVALALGSLSNIDHVVCPVRPRAERGGPIDRRNDVLGTWTAAERTQFGPKIRTAPVDYLAPLRDVESDFARLSATLASAPVWAVVHCAALDGYRFPRADLQRVNVDGTAATARLAAALNCPFIHISSCAARLFQPQQHGAASGTNASLGFRTQYAESKADAERWVVRRMAEGGLPRGSCVVDIGYLFSDDSVVMGSEQHDDLHVVESMWKLCLRVGAIPWLAPDATCIDHTHVDDAARAIGALAADGRAAAGPRFLLRHPQPLNWNAEVVPVLRRQLQDPDAVVSYARWRELVREYCSGRRARLGWLSNLVSSSLEADVASMFAPPAPSETLLAGGDSWTRRDLSQIRWPGGKLDTSKAVCRESVIDAPSPSTIRPVTHQP